MIFLSEKEKKVVNMEVEMDASDIASFTKYFDDFCRGTEFDQIKINWAIIDILKKSIESEKKKNEE